jgi:hypothetical protein
MTPAELSAAANIGRGQLEALEVVGSSRLTTFCSRSASDSTSRAVFWAATLDTSSATDFLPLYRAETGLRASPARCRPS